MMPDDYDAIHIVIGGPGHLSHAAAIERARQVKLVIDTYPLATYSLHLSGYDDDPRELWDIPEAARFVAWFADALHSLGVPPDFPDRLAPESIRWKAIAP